MSAPTVQLTLRERGILWVSGLVFAALVVIALTGPWLSTALGLPDRADSSMVPFDEPSPGHPLGADYLGRDVAARLFHGGTDLLVTAVVATLLTEFIALAAVGALTYRRRVAPAVRMVLDAFVVTPPIVVLVIIVTLGRSGPLLTSAAVAALSIPFAVRYLEAAMAPIIRSGYAECAALEGDPPWRVFLREVLPNSLPPIAADAGIRFVTALFLVSTARFIGASTAGFTEDWASMVQLNYEGIADNPWAVAAPCLALGLLAISANLLADRASVGPHD